MFPGVGLVIRPNNYNFKSLKWNQGYYKFQLFKEIIIDKLNNDNNQHNDSNNEPKNNLTTTVSYDIYD
jgi:hypothetical protein